MKQDVETLQCNISTIQQQTIEKAKIDDGVFLKDNFKKTKQDVETLQCNVSMQCNISAAIPQLKKDTVWKNQFIGQLIHTDVETLQYNVSTQFDLLLQHFQQTSISSGAVYKDIAAVKRHFFNWFNANLKKNALSTYINKQKAAPKKIRKKVVALIPKTNTLLDKIYGQQCNNEAHLHRCLQLLMTHLLTYEKACKLLQGTELTAVQSCITDIQKIEQLVQRGQKAGQLNWFFAKRQPKKPNRQQPKKGSPQNGVHQLTTTLSNRFARC